MGVVNVDDRSPQVVFNAGGWTLGGSQQEFGGTTHGTNLEGSTATFRFTGTSVTVYGSVSASFKSVAPVSTYSLDDGAPVTFAPNAPADDLYRVVFYSAAQLSSGQHTLVIRSGRAGAHFWLDYFSYTTDDGTPSSPPTQPPVSTQQKPSPDPTNTSVGQATGTTTVVTTAPPNQTSGSTSNGVTVPNQTFTSLVTADGNNPTAVYSLSISTAPNNLPSSTSTGGDAMASSSSTGGSSMSTGPMVGIALGAVALVIAVLLLLWVIIRQRRKRIMAASSLYSADGTPPPASQVEAFPSTHATYSNSDGAFHKNGGTGPATQAISANSNSSEAGTSNVDNVLAAKYGASEGQQVLVVYEPYPTEAPPDYRLRQSTV